MTTSDRDFAARILGGSETPDVDAALARVTVRLAKTPRRTVSPAFRILAIAAMLALAIALAGPAAAVVRNVINAVAFSGARITTQPESMGGVLRSFAVYKRFNFEFKSPPQRCISSGVEARRLTGLRLPVVAYVPSGLRADRCAYEGVLGGTQTWVFDPLVARSHGLTLPEDLAKASIVFVNGRGLLQAYVDTKDPNHRFVLETVPERTFSVHGASLERLVAWYIHESNTTPGQRRTISDLLTPHPSIAVYPENRGIWQGGHIAEVSVNGSAAIAFTGPRMAALTWYAPGRSYLLYGPSGSLEQLHAMAESVTTPY